MNRRRVGSSWRLIAVLLAGTMALGWLTGCRSASGGAAATAPAVAATRQSFAPSRATTDLPSVGVAGLPPQAVDTLELIATDGPFPYSNDGANFGNREGILPTQPKSFYAECTIVTPGSDDRGARRIVAGDDGSRCYTSDHYASFREVISG